MALSRNSAILSLESVVLSRRFVALIRNYLVLSRKSVSVFMLWNVDLKTQSIGEFR